MGQAGTLFRRISANEEWFLSIFAQQTRESLTIVFKIRDRSDLRSENVEATRGRARSWALARLSLALLRTSTAQSSAPSSSGSPLRQLGHLNPSHEAPLAPGSRLDSLPRRQNRRETAYSPFQTTLVTPQLAPYANWSAPASLSDPLRLHR